MVLHREFDKGKFICLECLVYGLINYLRRNYLRLIYTDFEVIFICSFDLS